MVEFMTEGDRAKFNFSSGWYIKGYRDPETGTVQADRDRYSQFITCFECGADARTHIALLSSTLDEDDTDVPSVIPDVKELIAVVNAKFNSINPILHEKFASFQ